MKYLIICFSLIFSAFAQETEKKVEFKDRLFFNGNIGASFGNVTQVQLSPGVGIRVTDRLGAGLGVTYIYASDDRQTPKISQSVFGPRAFANYDLFNQLYLTTRYEHLRLKVRQGTLEVKDDVPIWNIGAGYRLGQGRLGFGIEFLYDVLHEKGKSLSGEAYSIQGGFSIGL